MLPFSNEQIKEISEQLDCGFRAFYHKQTGELMFVPNTDRYYDMDTSAWEEDLDKLEENFLVYKEIYAMEASDSFKVMADFTEQLADKRFQDKLINALNRKGPFKQFKFTIDNSEYRQHWFDFKNNRYIEWTEDQLKIQNQHEDQENSSHEQGGNFELTTSIITRIWHGTTKTRDADAYLEYIRRTGLEEYTSTPGNISAKILRRTEDDICHFYTITEWDNIDSIKKFAGEDFEKAKYYDEDKKYLLEFEEKVNHYETFS